MSNRKYVRILAKDLPDVFYTPESGNVYFVRYRVASEDGRLTSRWSQKFEVPTNIDDLLLPSTDYKATINSNVLNITWKVTSLIESTPKKIFVNRFHVYVKFYTPSTENTAQWKFLGETNSTSLNTTMENGTNKADVAVLIPTYRGLNATNISPAPPATLFPQSVLFTTTA